MTRVERKSKLRNKQALLMLIPIMVGLSACTGEVKVGERSDSLANPEVTKADGRIIWPDSNPSAPDGSVYYKQMNCAECHGADGHGVAGKCDLDLTNVDIMRTRKPVHQYATIAFGEGKMFKTPVLSGVGGTPQTTSHEDILDRSFTHPAYSDKLQKRQLWDLVFYCRSMAAPLLTKKEADDMKALFGANCAVCHGTRGAGDGPLNKGLVLQPAPANFNQFNRFYDRTDEQIWDHIANGIKWEGMPNFLGKEDKKNNVKFDPPYIWKLTQYIRNFHVLNEYELEKPNATGAAPATSTPTSTPTPQANTPAPAPTNADAPAPKTN